MSAEGTKTPEQINKALADASVPPAHGPAEILSYGDFVKVELRFGTVQSAERVPKSDKLIKMLVNFGAQTRQILAGVGKTFEPEQLIGEQFLFVVNLAPRKMMGLESHGMMLATGDPTSLVVIKPSKPVEPGAQAG